MVIIIVALHTLRIITDVADELFRIWLLIWNCRQKLCLGSNWTFLGNFERFSSYHSKKIIQRMHCLLWWPRTVILLHQHWYVCFCCIVTASDLTGIDIFCVEYLGYAMYEPWATTDVISHLVLLCVVLHRDRSALHLLLHWTKDQFHNSSNKNSNQLAHRKHKPLLQALLV